MTRVNLVLTFKKLPCNYCLTSQEKAIEWVKKKITAITKDHRTVLQKCLGSV